MKSFNISEGATRRNPFWKKNIPICSFQASFLRGHVSFRGCEKKFANFGRSFGGFKRQCHFTRGDFMRVEIEKNWVSKSQGHFRSDIYRPIFDDNAFLIINGEFYLHPTNKK